MTASHEPAFDAPADGAPDGPPDGAENAAENAASALVQVATLHSITRLAPEHAGQVVVAASHGGVYAGFCAAQGRVRAVIFNDAGVGREGAGIGSLAWLDRLGIAAATADSLSCRIGDGDDMFAGGIVSFVNDTAAALGCAAGQTVARCSALLRSAAWSARPVPPLAESRHVVRAAGKEPAVVVLDSVSLVGPADAGAIVVTASHGGLLGGDPASAIKVAALAAVYCDAGFGKDGAGVSRLPALDRRAIAAATVSARSARIGDGRSVFADGIVSCVNATAANAGVEVGDRVRDFVDKITAAGHQRIDAR